jgi:outer membrane protein OmpA-like peptidoglycan-associated protein
VEIVGEQMTITGAVASLAVRDAIGAFAARSEVSGGEARIQNSLNVSGPVTPPPGAGERALFDEPVDGEQDVQSALDDLLRNATIEFRPSSIALADDGEALVRRVAEVLLKNPEVNVTVTGHTDNQGDPDRNLTLSVERAERVRARLIELGVGSERITASGEGNQNPVADNATPAGRRQNRRIEIEVNLG